MIPARLRALLVVLLLVACSGPSPTPPMVPTPAATAELSHTRVPAPTPSPTWTPTAKPTAPPSPTPLPAALDVVVLNGATDLGVVVDGRAVPPGRVVVTPGWHHVAALVDGVTLAETEVEVAPDTVTGIELLVPPPLLPLAVVIENSPEARPQSGLVQADVVYETLTEGGIARFLAVYLSGEAAVVGPVRSLRHYFAFTAAEYGAALVHVGASPQGFAWRDAMYLRKLDESAGDPGVWRVRSRAAPHNAYTGTAAARAHLAERGLVEGGSWGPLRQHPDVRPAETPAEQLTVTFWPSPYSVSYRWDAALERYRRSMVGAPHRDAETGEQLTTSAVVVQFAPIERIHGDDKGRVDIGLVEGGGELLVFGQGSIRHGSWRKGGPDAPTEWLDEEGNPLLLPLGPVWVEIVPLTAVVAWE